MCVPMSPNLRAGPVPNTDIVSVRDLGIQSAKRLEKIILYEMR